MTPIRLRTRLAARLLCAGFAVGLVPSAFGQSPDDTGYDRYRGQSGEGSTLVGRAWQDAKKWASDRGTGFTKSFGDGGKADPSLMPLSPAILPEYANGNRAPAGPPQPPPSATQPFGFRPPQTQPQPQPPQSAPPLARHPQSPFAFGGGPVMAGPQGTGAPPAQLAGKPAYNWYGYGSAPSAGSPQASQNWIQQTGATAGAFPIMTGRPQMVPPPSPPGFVGGPKVVSVIPTLPTIAPPPPPVVEAPPAANEPKTIPTIRPTATAPAAVYTAPAEAPAPKSDEPEWQPAPRRATFEQTSGKAEAGRVVAAVAFDAADNEPSWQTAPKPKPVAPVAPVVKTIERAPALLPVPIPAAPAGVPVIETVSAPEAPQAPVAPAAPTISVPVVTVPAIPTPVESVPTFVPVPTPTVAPPPQPPAPAPTTWQSTSGYQAPQRPKAPATQPNPATRSSTATTGQPNPANPKTGWKPRANAPMPIVPATMANGLASPPPDAPTPQVIPVTASRQVLELERQIRAATVRTATILEVTEIAPQKYVVKLVSKSEAAARDAAAAISALPALKPFAIDFEVRLAGQ